MRTMEEARLGKLNELLAATWEGSSFYRKKWLEAGAAEGALDALTKLASYPLTSRRELLADQLAHPPHGTNLTGPFASYKRFHCSSGTTGMPLFCADTAESWEWLVQASRKLFEMAGITAHDRLLISKPLGRSLGGWMFQEGAVRIGAAWINPNSPEPGELSRWTRVLRPTVLAGSPRLLSELLQSTPREGVEKLILTGPGSIKLRENLEKGWKAASFDRYGLTEAGPVACECTAHPGGLHLLEEEFVAESIHPASGEPAEDGAEGELVLTGLGRRAFPVIRYRTGDLVRMVRAFACACGRNGPFLAGGIRRME